MKKLLFIIGILISNSIFAQDLLIATTLSTEATAHIIKEWQKSNTNITIKTLNRTSASIERLVNSPFSGEIDMIISSSPMLLSHLKADDMLSQIVVVPEESRQLVPNVLQNYAAAFAMSGFGILSNEEYLKRHNLSVPLSWEDLALPAYYGLLSMSTPSRSDTTHMMIESLLQEYGWERGWQIIMEMGGNIGTISSRSYGVVDKINLDLSVIGITIDNYAISNNNEKLVFQYFPNHVPIPTFITILKGSQHKESAQKFIDFLLSPQGQLAVSDPNTGKYPIIPSHDLSLQYNYPVAYSGSKSIDYNILLKRQEVVRQLFDIAVTFRLEQLKDTWKLLYDAEKKQGHQLTDIRQLLTEMPVTETQVFESSDNAKNSDLNTEYQSNLIKWKDFFKNQNKMAIKELEKLQ